MATDDNGPVTLTRWAIVPSDVPDDRVPDPENWRGASAFCETYEEALAQLAGEWRLVNLRRIVRITMTIEHVAYGWDTDLVGDDDGTPRPEKAPIDPALTRPAVASPPPAGANPKLIAKLAQEDV